MNLTTGSSIVDQMKYLNITGNVIPPTWYKIFNNKDPKTEFSGKIRLLAINILADIVYWYRPIEIRDEKTGYVIGYKKRFKADLLQKSYDDLCQMFMCSKKDAQRAVTFLESFGVIKRVFRNLKVSGVTVANVLFLQLDVDVLKNLTYPKGDPSGQNSPHPKTKSSTPKNDIVQTNTEITSEITSETSVIKENVKEKVKEKETVDYQGVIDLYNETCVSLPSVQKLTDKRKRALKARLKNYSVEDLKTVFEKAEESPFLNGSSGKWSGATFDWLIKEDNIVKVLEGNYDDKVSSRKASYDLDAYEKENNLKEIINDFNELNDKGSKRKGLFTIEAREVE